MENNTIKSQRELSRIMINDGNGIKRLINLQELWQYRDLFWFLVKRDIKTRYAQSIMGVGWAIIQPVFSMIIFTIVFGNIAKINSEGIPYAIFSYTALVPWTYFSSSLTDSSKSLISSKNLITKVYFPRLVIPIAPVLAKLIDFGISFLILIGMMVWFGIKPSIWAAFIPIFVLIMMLAAGGVGMWLTALSIQYRDIQYGSSFFIQLLMYISPVIYPASNVPDKFQLVYAMNPMVGVIEGFRAVLLGTHSMPWFYILIGSASALVLFISGALYFRHMERYFADVA